MEQLINTFCEAFVSWDRLGQAIFILIVLGFILIVLSGLATFFYRATYWMAVWFRGWPPEHVREPEDES